MVVGEAIEVANAYDDTALAGRVADVEAAATALDGRLDTVEDKVNGFFATVENPDAVIDTLAEIQKYIADDKTGAAGMAASIKENTDAIDVLNGTGDGSVAKAITDAISTQAATDTAKYATKDALAAVSAKADAAAVASEVEAALEGKVDDETLENYYTKTETYTKQEIGTLLDGITGGSQETAASVKRQLDDYKAEMATKLGNVDKKDGEQDVAIQANTNAIADISDETSGILAQAKADAQAKVTALANGTVANNTSAISAVDTKVNQTNENVTTLTGRVAALEQADTDLGAEIEAIDSAHKTLSGTVAGHTTAIKNLEDRATAVEEAVADNTAKFAEYSTTAQVNKAIDDKIAAIDHDKLEEDIAANAKAIGDEVTRAKARENEIAAIANANATAVSTNAAEITRIDNVLKAIADGPNGEGIDSIKELATWIEEHETDVLPAIEDNTEAIAVLNGTGEGSVKKTVDDAIAAIPFATALQAGLVKSSDEVTVGADGVMGIGKVSTDKLVQGINELVLNGGTAGVAKQ